MLFRSQQACRELCTEFSELFKPELGCHRGVQLEIEFKPDARPVFCKPRSVPFAMQDELAQAYDVGIAKEASGRLRHSMIGELQSFQ